MMQSQIVLVSVEELKQIVEQAITCALVKVKDEKQELLSFKDVCELLQIHPSTLNKWKSENRIPYKKLGKRVYFKRSELMESLAETGHYRQLLELKA